MKQREKEIMNDILDGNKKRKKGNKKTNEPGAVEINSINKASTRNPKCIN